MHINKSREIAYSAPSASFIYRSHKAKCSKKFSLFLCWRINKRHEKCLFYLLTVCVIFFLDKMYLYDIRRHKEIYFSFWLS